MKLLTHVDIHVESRDTPRKPPPQPDTQRTDYTSAMTQETTSAILEVTPSSDTDQIHSEYLQLLTEGSSIPGDSQSPFVKPDWYDEDKFRIGQKFAIKYMFGVMYAEMLSLIWLFLLKSGLDPLKFTGKSNSPYKAFMRYLSTVERVKSWYEEDIWECDTKAHRNLKIVRKMHDTVRHRMTSLPADEVVEKVALEGEGKTPLWTTLHEEVCADFRSSCPVLRFNLTGPRHTYVNQSDMAITQLGFMGLILIYPQMFGIHDATDVEFDGFVHLWRTIGYCLGVEDRFNLCAGDVATVRRRSREIFDHHVIPSFTAASREWHHMSRCMVEGISYFVPGASFEVVVAYLCRVFGVATPRLHAKMTWGQMIWFYVTVVLYAFVVRIPGTMAVLNRAVNVGVKRVRDSSPEWKRMKEERVYPYENRATTSVVF